METNPPIESHGSARRPARRFCGRFHTQNMVPDFMNLKQLSKPMNPINKKISTFLSLMVLAALSVRGQVLFQDSTNYPYTDGLIEGQGQWYSYSPRATPGMNTFVTNNTLLLVGTTTNDAVATPTNGWVNSTEFNFASFELNVSQLPASTNGGYFCQLQNINDTNDCCHVFIDTRNTGVPGTYRLGIANFATSFTGLEPPNNFPMDLAPGVNYTVVVLFDTNQNDQTFVGATLWVNPSQQDFQNVVDAAGGVLVQDAVGYTFGTDTTQNPQLLGINISQIGFSPYITAGVSNVIAGTNFATVNTTNLPVFGINPQSQTNYSGNSTAFYAVASAVDATNQWYSSAGALTDDGVNIIGSTSNTLTLNNLSATDYYYSIVTDAYGNHTTSAFATNSIITTPTAPFFTNAPVNLTNNLFTQAAFTNLAFGTGPLTYQWYFAPSNSPTSFSPMFGQTSPTLYVTLADFTSAGNYFVVASNTVGGGSVAFGPTNNITELPPLVATLQQLHNLLIAATNQLATNASFNINSNNVIVTGTVSSFHGYGTSYSQFWIQDAMGFGLRVFFGSHGNTNTPPIGTSLTISGPIAVFSSALEIDPTSFASFTTNYLAPTVPIYPTLHNSDFLDLATNTLGVNALNLSDSQITFTNVYLYGSATGGAFGSAGSHSGVGGIFDSNTFTVLYFTVGAPYHVPDNTNTIEIFQPGYNIGTTTNEFADVPIPTHCYQLTGVYTGFNSGGHIIGEITSVRLADFVTNPPPAFSSSIAVSGGHPTVTWGPVQAGSTYSAKTASSASGPWTITQQGLAYYPTNGSFTDTNLAPAKLYLMTSP
jgi:hypothetical protein